MKWEELEHHFRAETRQDPPPFGEGVVEWDYSRYTRALGMGRTPGLDTLKRRGCAVAAGRPEFWDEVAERMQEWSEERGWRFLKLSARPSTVVPDPVIYHLGVEVTHPDSLIFCGAGQQGKPALGKRPRSPAMRIPLSAAERWLIAADRVRRRVRAEAAVNGLVLFIEEAEQLTPSALSILSYFLDAQCAWKSHLLCSPAQIYIVFATPARDEEWFRQTLGRFSPRLEPFVARDFVGPQLASTSRAQTHLTVEQDHVLNVLRFAQVSMCAEEVARLLGSVGARLIDFLQEAQFISTATERGRTVLCVRSESPQCQLAESAVAAVHSSLASAELGPSLATRLLDYWRSAPTPSSTRRRGNRIDVVSRFEEALLAPAKLVQLCSSSVESDAVEAGATDRILLCAAFRDYSGAHAALTEWCGHRHEPDAWAQLVTNLLRLGHHAVANTIQDGDWPTISTRVLDEPAADALTVAAELFFMQAWLRSSEVCGRARVLDQLLRHQGSGLSGRLAKLPEVQAVLAQLLTRLQLRLMQLGERSLAARTSRRLRALSGDSTPAIPAYLMGCVEWMFIASACGRRRLGARETDRALARDGKLCSGTLADLLTVYFEWAQRLNRLDLHWFARPLVDELVLFWAGAESRVWARKIRRLVFCVVQPQSEAHGAATTLVRNCRGAELTSETAWEKAALSRATLDLGSPVQSEAFARLALGVDEHNVDPVALFRLVLAGLQSVEGPRIGDYAQYISRLDGVSSSTTSRFMRMFVAAADRLEHGDLAQATVMLRSAREAIADRSYGAEGVLYRESIGLELRAARFQRWMARAADKGSAASELCRGLRGGTLFTGKEARARSAPEPALILYILEGCARSDPVGTRSFAMEIATRCASFLVNRFGWRNVDLVEKIKVRAPAFYSLLACSACTQGIDGSPAAHESAELVSAIATLLNVSSIEQQGRHEAAHGISRLSHPSSKGVPREWSARRRARFLQRRADGDAFFWHVAATRCIQSSACERVRFAGVFGNGCNWTVRDECEVRLHGQSYFVVTRCADTRTRGMQSIDPRHAGGAPFRLGSTPEIRRNDRACHPGQRLVVGSFLGDSDGARSVRRDARRAASTSLPVMILGESGTGKELLARAIHNESDRSDRPFIALNCAAIPSDLMESELFGHERGAFTGATDRRLGLIGAADSGTLFIDEIDSMPSRMQVLLLRVLESGEYRRVGSNVLEVADLRVISAGSPAIRSHIESGRFRQDLYYRMSTLMINPSPINQRPEDIETIALAVAEAHNASLDSSALEVLRSRVWPGNVRELVQVVETCVELSGRSLVTAADLDSARSGAALSGVGRVPANSQLGEQAGSKSMVLRALSEIPIGAQFASSDLVKKCSLSRRTVQRILAELVVLGRLDRIGAGRATAYRVPVDG